MYSIFYSVEYILKNIYIYIAKVEHIYIYIYIYIHKGFLFSAAVSLTPIEDMSGMIHLHGKYKKPKRPG